ncbi:MAG: DUF2130 domain-containing protein [Epsilonproteobacteria bacterium]|nr:DUF2130 domain-containing protein [Campylobacterota bacterium]
MKIKCPNCHYEFEPVYEQLEEKAKEIAQQQLLKERRKIEEKIREEILKENEKLIEFFKKELQEKSEEIDRLRALQLEVERLKTQQKELEYKKERELQQRLQQELQLLQHKLQEEIATQYQLQLAQKDKLLQQVSTELEELKRKTTSVNPQLQGEVMEIAIEQWLRARFPLDLVKEVKKGVKGADCIQIINTPEIPNCATICYEVKRTKVFKREWIEKVKEDMREVKADIGVIVTQALPKDVERIGLIDGVWICDFESFKAFIPVLREFMLLLSFSKRSQENKQDKMNLLYSYLTSNEFKLQMESIIDEIIKMKSSLEREKRAMTKIWREREKQIEKVIQNATYIYGDLSGIIGNIIPPIEALELKP